MGLSIETTFYVHIGTVKFASQFMECPCSTEKFGGGVREASQNSYPFYV